MYLYLVSQKVFIKKEAKSYIPLDILLYLYIQHLYLKPLSNSPTCQYSYGRVSDTLAAIVIYSIKINLLSFFDLLVAKSN